MTDACANCGLPRAEHAYNGACYGVCGDFVEIEIRRAGPFEADCCEMPKPAARDEAAIYRSFRNHMMKAHCADKRPAHLCAGAITITRDAITFQCPRCGDAKQLLEGS